MATLIHKDRLGRPLQVGDRVLVINAGPSIYTFFATITRFRKSRVYFIRDNFAPELYKQSTCDFIYVSDQEAANRNAFPELFI